MARSSMKNLRLIGRWKETPGSSGVSVELVRDLLPLLMVVPPRAQRTHVLVRDQLLSTTGVPLLSPQGVPGVSWELVRDLLPLLVVVPWLIRWVLVLVRDLLPLRMAVPPPPP